MSENTKIELPIKEIVEAQLKVAIMQTLQPDAKRIIEQLVHSVLNSTIKVDYREQKFLDYHFAQLVQEQAKEALKEWLKENAPAIRKAVDAHLKKTNFAELVAKKFTDEALHASVSISLQSRDR